MKGMIKSLMLVIIASFLFASCDEKMKELKEQVDKFNKECPISLGETMTLNSAMLDDKTVEMKFTTITSLTLILSSFILVCNSFIFVSIFLIIFV